MANLTDREAARQLYGDRLDDLPERWKDAFSELTAQGRKPSAVLAAIEYITTGAKQSEAAEKYGVSESAVRDVYPLLLEAGPVETATPARRSHDYAVEIFDELGWQEGVEYTFTANNQPTPTPKLKNEGWKRLHDVVVKPPDA